MFAFLRSPLTQPNELWKRPSATTNFQFASGQFFSASYLRGQSGLVYLLTYPVLFFGRAGTALGIDGLIARGIRKAKPFAWGYRASATRVLWRLRTASRASTAPQDFASAAALASSVSASPPATSANRLTADL